MFCFFANIFRLLSVAEVNSYLLYKKVTSAQEPELRKPLTHGEFTLQLIKDLVAMDEQPLPKPKGRPSLKAAPDRLVPAPHQHSPTFVPPTPCKARPTRNCVVCHSVKIRKESRYMCSKCQVCLCVVPCFGLYHSVTDYSQARRNMEE